jgi:hypothetical protein
MTGTRLSTFCYNYGYVDLNYTTSQRPDFKYDYIQTQPSPTADAAADESFNIKELFNPYYHYQRDVEPLAIYVCPTFITPSRVRPIKNRIV